MYLVVLDVDVLLEDFEQYVLDCLCVLIVIEENWFCGKCVEEVDFVVLDLWKKYM